MNRESLYHNTVNVLLDAYNNGTLSHGDTCGCAIGNICKGNYQWCYVFVTNTVLKQQITYSTNEYPLSYPAGVNLIQSTGYSTEELMKIEYAFEFSIINTNHNDKVFLNTDNYDYWKNIDPKQGQFIGLTAVLNVLKEIHTTPEIIVAENQNKLVEIKNKFELV
jgi:hypothetical protein